jgi:hypothetical protein
MIKMSTKTLLDDAVERGFNELDKMDVGSEEYVKTIDPLTRLSDRLIELEKLDLEKDKQYDDKKLRLKEMKQEQLDRYIKHGLTAISVIGGIALTVWGAKASWKFEETGTITSTPGRKFIGNLFFKK